MSMVTRQRLLEVPVANSGKAWTPQYIFTDKSTFDDNDIMDALAGMVTRGVITPSVNTIYAVHASPGIAITFSGMESCKTFCAYHSNMGLDDGSSLIYTVIPDTDCALCGGFYNDYNNFGMMSSHELVEAITNPDTANGWYAGTADVQDEIGDICAWQLATIKGNDGVNYPVQKIWSNVQQACITLLTQIYFVQTILVFTALQSINLGLLLSALITIYFNYALYMFIFCILWTVNLLLYYVFCIMVFSDFGMWDYVRFGIGLFVNIIAVVFGLSYTILMYRKQRAKQMSGIAIIELD
ncbi:hypothetical protein HDV06_000737 [Boothiomyces sp. JEL0866]|nr:hypothetical protein HDV06_000727 [Boothiomyces sp. JEL0866]KAJ3318244.1 hypothetical protein HDV06_000737 [Boothiomyces sp. JEL0866]